MNSFFNNYFFLLLAILAGIAMPTQAAVNSKLAASVESPVVAAFISFAVGTIALFAYILFAGVPLTSITASKDAPLVAWIGGFLGAFFVTVMVIVVPRIGIALAFSLAIAGQMLVTLIIDHYGLLGIPEKQISWPRVLGALMITGGVILIRRF